LHDGNAKEIKVFRLEKASRHSGTYLTIEGELKSESVGSAESACREALADGKAVTIVVRHVTEIDADGYAFLKRLVKTRARVRAVGIYSRYVLRILKNGGATQFLQMREHDVH
jgi:hypothetical protein